ncbi:MAG: hypothetical protein ACM3II_17970 [Rhodospirillaceae bacterium]
MGRTQPTATNHWKRVLEKRDSSEIFALADQVENLTTEPAFVAVMGLVSEGRDAILDLLIKGPTREQADYARQIGYIAGLEELENAVEAVREVAATRRHKLQAQAEAERTSAEEEA